MYYKYLGLSPTCLSHTNRSAGKPASDPVIYKSHSSPKPTQSCNLRDCLETQTVTTLSRPR